MKPSFSRYEVLGRLASGGMADVWLARVVGPEGFEKQVVIKTLLPSLAADPAMTQMFLNEARLAARLSHPNCVQIFDLGLEGTNYFIAMEFIDGFPMSRLLRRAKQGGHRLVVPLVARVVAEAATGLDYAHRLNDREGQPMNLVHRDVSPDNILVSFDGQVKVVDFGVAKVTQKAGTTSGTSAGHVKGKFGYMAPEYLRGEAIDRRADVFALGVCLYQGLTYKRPFAGPTDAMIMHAILEADAPAPSTRNPNVPPALDEVVRKALIKNPAERYESARAFRQALEAAVPQMFTADALAEAMALLWPPGDEERSRVVALAAGETSEVSSPALSPPGSSSVSLPRAIAVAIEANVPAAAPPSPGPVEAHGAGRRPRAAIIGALGILAALVAIGLFLVSRSPPTPVTLEPAHRDTHGTSPADAGPLATPPAVPEDSGVEAAAAVPETGHPTTGVLVGRPEENQAPRAQVGKVEVTSDPPVEVFWKGRRLGRTPGAFSVALGNQTLNLSNKELGIARTVAVTLSAGPAAKVAVKFAKGWLDVRASPWADVKLDGRSLGTTPLPEQEVYEGVHLVELSNAETGKTRALKVAVTPGEHKTVRESMK